MCKKYLILNLCYDAKDKPNSYFIGTNIDGFCILRGKQTEQ